jgi:hypothetical protein
MGRGIQECILYHVNSHRGYYCNNRLFLELGKCEGAQKDAQYILDSILCGASTEDCVHKNPFPDGYCHELVQLGFFRYSWDTTIQDLIWGLLGSRKGHRERLLDLERDSYICHHSHMAAEIAHDSNSGLTILTMRLYNFT